MSAVDYFFQAPPVARTLTAGALVISVLVHGGFLSAYHFIWYLPLVFKLPVPGVWRFVTSFLISGPQLAVLLDPYFLFTYASQLETGSPRFTQPGDFFFYIVFVCSVILGLNSTFAVFGGVTFISALFLAFAHTSSQDNRGSKASFFVVTIPIEWLPLAMLLITLVTNGMHATAVQSTGLIAAHLYDFLTRIYPTFGGGRNLVKTPAFIRRMFSSTEATVNNRAYGTAFTPAQQEPARASGSSAGVLPESWRSRGSGHRLGGD